MGPAITKQKIKTEDLSFTCPNPKCKRAFANPIIVQNLSSEDTASYYACPNCLTEIEETPKSDEKRQKPKGKKRRIERTKVQLAERKPAKKPSPEMHKCLHYFGYLSQRPRGEEILEECMICEKIIECILKFRSNSSMSEIESKIPTVKEVEELAEETVEKGLEETLKPKIKTERLPAGPSANQFLVENLGMLYASWSNTALIDRETLSGWGKTIKEIEIETADGKKARCKVKPMEDSRKRIIQIPDKIQLNLETTKGESVIVKPVTKLQKARR